MRCIGRCSTTLWCVLLVYWQAISLSFLLPHLPSGILCPQQSLLLSQNPHTNKAITTTTSRSLMQLDMSAGGGSKQQETASNVHSMLGYKHDEESRARISAANKGKPAWNKGKTHSEATKAKIRESIVNYATAQKEKRALALNMTLEEYDARKLTRKSRSKFVSQMTPTLTDEEIAEKKEQAALLRKEHQSKLAKERWQNSTMREKYVGRGRVVTEETRRKISESLKKRWQDPALRQNMSTALNLISQKGRERMAMTLREKWKDPEFRERMLATRKPFSNEHRSKISDSVRKLWETDDYRERVGAGMKSVYESNNGRRYSISSIQRPKRAKPKKKPAPPSSSSIAATAATAAAAAEKKKAEKAAAAAAASPPTAADVASTPETASEASSADEDLTEDTPPPPPRPRIKTVEKLQMKTSNSEIDRAIAIKQAKAQIRSQQSTLSIREQIGSKFWNQEKVSFTF